MRKYRLITTFTRIVVVLFLIVGGCLGFPNDPELATFYWGAVLLEEIGCVVFLK